jgi:L-lactate utilization protein LutC
MEEQRELIKAKRWHFEKEIEETLKSIRKNNMEGIYAKDKEAALKEVLKRIPKNATVSHGGSFTLRELGMIEILKKGEYRYLREKITQRHSVTDDMRLEDFSSDVFLTSVNAITLEGELIAMDGFGNRVACLLFGPKKVVVIAGKNKIVKNLEDGMNRIREYAAPIHAKRRNWDLPCTKVGKCVDCKDPGRICNKIGILKYERDKERTTVILVGEDLGI